MSLKRDSAGKPLVVNSQSKAPQEEAQASATDDAIDKQLLERFVQGDRAAFNQLVTRHKERIYSFIYFQIGQKQADAEDLTQDVFIELYKQAENYRGESKFTTYLFAISRNLMLNYFRSHKRRFSDQTDSISQEQLEPGNAQQLSKQLVSDECPLEQTINDNMQKKVASAIDQLKPEERQLLLLTDREGFSYEQIGQILSIKVGTVRSRLNAARNRLLDFLKS